MTRRSTTTGVASAALLAVVMTGCSHGGSAADPAPTTPPTQLATGVHSTLQNVLLSDYVRAQLLVAEVKASGLPRTAFQGFTREQEHFSYDTATKTFWGGAQVVPNVNSAAAKRALSGAGSYLIFKQTNAQVVAKDWTVYKAGSGACPVAIPANVLTAWGWAAGTCRPPS
jgi:hypothetical protein